jgi:hypothetical protein
MHHPAINVFGIIMRVMSGRDPDAGQFIIGYP